MSDLSTNIEGVLKSAPVLGQSPGIAVGVATAGGDVGGNAQAVAAGTNSLSDANAKATVASSTGPGLSGALNWFGNHVAHAIGDVAHDAETGLATVGKDAMKIVNAPLNLVQHEYRYLHDVEASHGMTAAILEGIGVATGGALGFVAGGVPGAAIGAEAAGGLEGQLFYRDSWSRTGSASYVDPHTHQPVSLGRDLISELGHVIPGIRQGTLPFKITSGLIDGIFDLSLGGPEYLKAFSAARAGTLGGVLGSKLADHFGPVAPQTVEDLYRVYEQNGDVKRAFSDIAKKSASEIALTPAYEPFARDAGMLRALGNAQTPDDVAQVFADAIQAHDLTFSRTLPTLMPTRVPFQKLREYAENAGGPLGSLAKGFTKIPDAWSSVEGQVKSISAHEFNPADPLDNGAVGLGRMLMYTESRRTAASVLDTYINAPDLETRVNIFRQASLNLLFKMGGFEGLGRDDYLAQFANPRHQEAMAKVLDDLVGGGAFGKESIYGVDDEGHILSLIRSRDGSWQYGAAIHPNQTGSLRFLDLSEAKRAAKMLQGAQDIFDAEGKGRIAQTLAGGDLVGRVGDFAYHHITQGIFKPLVLLTPSYAMHISLAELIPNTLRLGVRNMVRAGIAMNIAKLADKADYAGYASHLDEAISGMSWRMLDHLTGGKIREAIDSDQFAKSAMGRRIQLAARYIEYNDGYAPSALLSGHYSAAEIGQREEVSARLMRHAVGASHSQLGDSFRRFGPDDAGQIDAWQATLKDQANDPASQLAARMLIEEARKGRTLDQASATAAHAVAADLRERGERGELDWALRSNPNKMSVSADGQPYVHSFAGDMPPGMDQYDDWAKVIVADLRGATRGADKTLHVPLLQNIADGEWTDRHVLGDIPREQRPIYVKGQELVPSGESKIQRIANVGFHRVLNPMVNFLSRQTIAFAQFEQEYGHLAEAVERGTLDDDEAMTLAMNRTVRSVIRQVHNIHDRTQWSTTLRNWAPFYFAQEQAYRRFGRLLAENPAAFRKYALMIANIHDIGQLFQGPNGNGYFVLPGTGWMTQGVAGALARIGMPVEGSSPVGMGWNLSASSVIFPLSAGVRPDFGPLVAVPVQGIATLFPEMGAPALKADVTAAENTILGPTASTQPIWSQLIPNTIAQRIATALDPAVDQRSFNSTMMQVMQTLDFEGKIPAADAGYMKWQQFIDRVKNQTRTMFVVKALLGAVTPVSPEITDTTYDKFSGELSQDIQKYGSVNKGVTEFLSNNPDATPFTVFQSYSPTGSTPPDSVEAENWINDNSAFIAAHPYSAFYFMPQLKDNAYNQTVYNEQLAQGYRVKYDPDANPVGNIGSSFLAQLYIAAGNSFILDNPDNYPAYKAQIAGLTGSAKYNAEQQWYNVFLPNYGAQNPVWWQYWQGDTKASDRTQAINEIKSMVASGTVPNPESSQSKGIVGLMGDYQAYQDQLTAGYQNGFIGQTLSSINQGWQDYLDSVAQDNPELRVFINGAFMTLPASLGGTGG